MAIYRGTGGFSNVTGTSEIEYVTEKSVEIQNAVTEVGILASKITSNTSAAQAAADTAVAASNGVQGFASIASTKAVEAQASASNAQSSADTATKQALVASTSATNAATSELNAATYRTNASDSATTATTQASIAITKASEASLSASNASVYAATASNAADRAEAAVIILDKGTVDDNITTMIDTWSSQKVSDLFTSKQDVLVSGFNIKTVNNESILGSGNIVASPIDYKTVKYLSYASI
jgi:hypothetical protein